MKIGCLLLGVKKIFQKDEKENLILILHGVGVCKNCTNVKFRMFFFCLLFLSSYNVIRDFPPLS